MHDAIDERRIRSAWEGRVSGCVLGKPLEPLALLGGRDAVRGYLLDAGALPLRGYVPAVAGALVETLFASSCRDRITRAEADDDLNYTVLALLVLEEHGAEFTTEDVARAWFRHLPAGATFTAEREALAHLLARAPEHFGFCAPAGFDVTECASQQHGEWIGAQIRADLHGWVCPGQPGRAATLARRDAALSHRGDGVESAAFVAALAAAIPAAGSFADAVAIATREIPGESGTAAAVDLGRALAGDPAGPDRIAEHYAELPWAHAGNNLALVVWGLLSHPDDFAAAVGDTVAAGFDTDCTGATVGGLWGCRVSRSPRPSRDRGRDGWRCNSREWRRCTSTIWSRAPVPSPANCMARTRGSSPPRRVRTVGTMRTPPRAPGGVVREPYVAPAEQSPFAFDLSARERQERLAALRHDRPDDEVVTDASGLFVAFAGADDVETLLNDPRFGAIAMTNLHMQGITDGPLHDLWSLLMFGKDGDEHKRLRGTVSRELTPRAVEHYRADIERFADALAAALPTDRAVDLWSAFALPLAARAACRTVGIPADDADRVAVWALDLVNAFFTMSPERRARAERAAVEFAGYLDDLVAAKRAEPGDDVTSRLVATGAAHDLEYDETRALVANLVFGGLEATAKVITTGVFHLLVEQEWATVVARPDLAGPAVAELLRFAPPTGVGRYAREDLVCRDVQLRAGQMALLSLEGACRDARHHQRPDRLDVTRDAGRQLAFGAGAHFCLGANLAKVVLETALVTLVERFPSLRLACAPDEVEWDYETFTGIVSLPVETAP